MAAQHNDTAPAMGNQISADIPDIQESIAYHWDIFALLFSTQNTTTAASNVFGPSNGSYTFALPTNGVSANGVFMTGDSDTIIWMYLNTAPPGWKVTSTGADSLLAVAGGTAAYNVDGGNGGSGDTWTQPNHTHTGPSHNHQWYDFIGASSDDKSYASNGAAQNIEGTNNTGYEKIVVHDGTIGGSQVKKLDQDAYTSNAGTGNTGGSATANTWRPLASVGKLFQLDTA